MAMTRGTPQPFTAKQIELVTTFADQAVIAIENVRLFDAEQTRTRELSEALEQQTATAEILSVISNSLTDTQPVFDAIVRSGLKLFPSAAISVALVQNGMVTVPAVAEPDSARAEAWRRRFPVPLTRDYMHSVAILDRRLLDFPDVLAAPEELATGRQNFLASGYRAMTIMPMLRGGEAVGALSVVRLAPGPLSDKQIAVLRTFANQAVIAIENTRLLNELRQRTDDLTESLEQQTATSEVLQVISSSPGELAPVFNAMLENATRICGAKFGNLLLCEGGSTFRHVAVHGAPAEYEEQRRREPVVQLGLGTPIGRCVRMKQAVQVADLTQEKVYIERDPSVVFIAERAGARTVLAVPMLKEGEPIGGILIYRQEVRPFTDKQVELVSNFAAQAVIAIENTRLLNELRESLEQQTATSEVLRVISTSQGELQPVFQAMLENAVRICEAQFGNLALYDGREMRMAAMHNAPPAYEELRRREPVIPLGNRSLMGPIVASKSVMRFDDLTVEPYASWALPRLAGAKSAVGVPMLRDGELAGAIIIYRTELRAFTDKQIALLTNFAAQAVIAIENTRLLKELRQRTDDLTESLEQQTATSEVLRVISSSPGALEPVFQAMLENATRICQAKFGNFLLYDGSMFRIVSMHGVPAEWAEFRTHDPFVRPSPHHPLGRLVGTKELQHITDVRTERSYIERDPEIIPIVELGGARSALCVPLLRDNELVGGMTLWRQEVRPFTDKQVALVTNFAAQAVIAIENTRLLNELRQRTDDLTESLEQQTATSQVLQVISSSPGELEPVFNAMLENATRICEAKVGNLFLREGDNFRAVAVHGESDYADWFRRDPVAVTRDNPGTPLDRLTKTKQVLHIPDLRDDQSYRDGNPRIVSLVDTAGARTHVVVPMLKENELIGAIVIYRQEVRPFSDKQIALVQNFAAQAVIAIENTRLLNELRARTSELAQSVEELRALGAVSQAVNSTLDLETVLSTIVTKAAQLSGTEAGAIYVFDEPNREFELRATYGMTEDMTAALKEHHADVSDALRAVTQRRAPDQIADLRIERAFRANELVLRLGFHARLVVPLLAADRIVGALVVRRKAPGEFAKSTVDLLQTFGAQSVLAIQNARLFTEIGEKSRQLAEASQHKSQFLANMSHELRTPLNAILGYTELILDDIYGEAPEKMRVVLQRVQTNGKHLLGLINDVLDLSKIEAGQLTLSLADYSISEMVHTVLVAVEPLASGKNLALKSELPPNLPTARGDERRIAQVLLNLVGNAIKFTDTGEVAVRASTANGSFTIAVRDTGPGVPEADQAKIFEEFLQADSSATKKKGGTGLGLSISKRIIKMHGGDIGVESRLGQGSTFSITLPLRVEKQAANE
jgi:GAF domain-containing protein